MLLVFSVALATIAIDPLLILAFPITLAKASFDLLLTLDSPIALALIIFDGFEDPMIAVCNLLGSVKVCGDTMGLKVQSVRRKEVESA